MRRIGLILGLLLVLAGRCEAQSGNGVPHSGIGPCPAGRVVSRLNANAPPTCVTTSGTGTVVSVSGANGLTTTNPTTTPQITIPNNTQYAAGFAGATADVKIAACLAALPSGGGTCDAQGLVGNQTIAATINIPANDKLLLGNATFTVSSSITPVFTYNSGTSIIGSVFPKSFIQVSGTGAYTVFSALTSTAIMTLENIDVHGGANNTDGSIGIDLDNTTNALLINNAFANIQTGIKCGGSAGTYYSTFIANQFGGVLGTGEDFETNCNLNVSILDQVRSNSASYGWRFRTGSVTNEAISPDCEQLTVGDCLDFASGGGETVTNPYMEASKGGIKLESTALYTYVTGSGHASSIGVDGVINYGTADQTRNFINVTQTGLSPLYILATHYMLQSGSEMQYFTIDDDPIASGTAYLEDIFTPGARPETSSGLTGHAGLRVGTLWSLGGNLLTGRTSTNQIATPSGLTCTPTCSGACATSYQYAVVCIDGNGGKTLKSSTATCSNNASLDTSDFNILTWTKQDGCRTWDIVGNQDLIHSVTTNTSVTIPLSGGSPGTVYSYKDTNNAPASYTPPTRNSTGDLTLASTAQLNPGSTLVDIEGAAPTGVASSDFLWGDSTAHRWKMNNNNGGAMTIPALVATGTSALNTGAITAGACATTVTTTATGTLTTDAITWSHNAAVTAGTNGSLIISAYPTADNVNFQECNGTSGSITPPADTLNWKVTR